MPRPRGAAPESLSGWRGGPYDEGMAKAPKIVLRKILKKEGLSVRQFAKRGEYHYHSVFQFFKPGYNPTFETMARWAKAIGCKVRDLIEE